MQSKKECFYIFVAIILEDLDCRWLVVLLFAIIACLSQDEVKLAVAE